MSRCFPFPPPGYEKKPSNDHEDLLIKEKQKEKKRRKEKKDKEKREGKERKEKEKKDHSKDRHKEKKDKKDKHRDKDKKKPKDRDKDKKKIFNERKSGEHTEGHNGGNPGEGSCQAEFIKDPKFTGELDRKIKDEENGVDNQMAGKIGGKVQRAVESMGSPGEKKGPGNKMGASDKVVQNITIQDQKVCTAASAVEKRGTEDGMHQNGADNQIVAKITGKVQRALEGMGGSAEKKGTGNKMVAGNKTVQSNTIPDHKMRMASSMEKTGTEDKMLQNGADNQQVEKFNGKVQRAFGSMGGSAEKKVTTGKMVTGNKMVPHITTPDQKMHMVSAMGKRGTEGEMLQNSICEEQRRVNQMDRQMAQDVHKKTEGKERTTAQELDRHKDRVQDKVHKEKKKEREKEKKKEKEKRKEKEKNKHKEQDKQRDIQRKEQEDSPNVKSLFVPEGNLKSVCADGSLKRKQTNGFLHENEMRCNKLPRLASSSKLPLENGRKLDQSLTGSPCASDNHKSVNLVKVEMVMHVENKVNGIIDISPPSSIPGRPLISTATETGDSCKRPPHPDEKYLSEILCIPRKEEWPEFDDQDWLLGGDVRQKPKIVHNADESPQVWASALRIETADVVALPYVIPY